ncbi:exopolysaccharide biosynthesis protein [Anaplasma bovis]|uniref:exopolysaccharide biosynthesis protein n=1 Tax=Anaplasma bovis TaxID=186733 RepID=UPI002FF31DA1
MDEDGRKAVSDILEEVGGYGEADTVTLFELKTILHDRGFGVFMLLFSLPLAIPLPTIPGYTTILALPLILFSVQMLMGRTTPWLPDFLERKSFKRGFLAMVIEKTSPLLKAMERWTKPRVMFIFCGLGNRIIALICLLCALSIAVPLPLTNFIPAGGISAIALGMLNRDGVLVVLGIVLGLLGLSITTVVLIAGPKLVIEMFSFVSKFFTHEAV